MQKRRSPLAKSLKENSKYALLNAIEIHNKPVLPYRYEICTILIINAWELIMKAYIYKYVDKKKAIYKNGKDGVYKSFKDCLDLIAPAIGKPFYKYKESLERLYEYRNCVVHSYGISYDVILHGLISQNVIFFKEFFEYYFNEILCNEKDLVLIPIGFENPISPIEFLSNESSYYNAPIDVQKFIKNIIDSSNNLQKEGISESILGNYKVKFQKINNIKNADIIASINKPGEDAVKYEKEIKLSNKKEAPEFKFSSFEEEKAYQDANYPLSYHNLLNQIKEKYRYKNRAGVMDEIKKYKQDSIYAYACRGELKFKYSENLVDVIGQSLEDNPRLINS